MYLPMVSLVSFRRTYCGRILSVPSRSSSLMDVDFANIKINANRFRCGLGRFIRVGKTKYIKDEDLEGTDKIRPQYVRRKDTKDNIGRYIVLLPEEKADSCQSESK